jgi:hypothetical protein
MQVTDLTKHLTRFYSNLFMITKRYGRLNLLVGKYLRPPRIQQTRGLPVNKQPTTESNYANHSNVLEDQPKWESFAPDAKPSEPASVSSITHTFPPLLLLLPATLQKNSTWKAAAALPKSAQFDSGQGHFVPFVSPVRSRTQTPYKDRPVLETSPTAVKTDYRSSSANLSETPNLTQTTNTVEQGRTPIQLSATAKRLLQAATSLPLIPLALAQSSITSTPTKSPNPVSASPNSTLSNQTHTTYSPVVPMQRKVATSPVTLFSLPQYAAWVALASRVPALQNIVKWAPSLGFNRAAVQPIPNLERATQLSESVLSLPPITSHGVHTPSLPVGTPQNLSQILSSYAENEASQARLHLNNRSIPRSPPTTQLPTLQSTIRKFAPYPSANNLYTTSTELPRLGSTEGQISPSVAVQRETLPRLSDWEVQNFGETEDQVSMDELRTKISKILAEELRRYLPGE